MAEGSKTRGHEYYLRYILLLKKAAPLALKAIINKKIGQNHLKTLLLNQKNVIEEKYKDTFPKLFAEDDVKTDVDLWDTAMLCVVLLVHFKPNSDSVEISRINCIYEQCHDLGQYASASLDFKTYKEKWDTLHDALLHLVNINLKDERDSLRHACITKMHSFQSENIELNAELIEQLENTNDINEHVHLALDNKVYTEVHDEREDIVQENANGTEKDDDITTRFIETLTDKTVCVDDAVVLACKHNKSDKPVTWIKDHRTLEETESIKFVIARNLHWLVISRARIQDTGNYVYKCENASTTAYINVKERDLKVIKELYVTEDDVLENMDISLTCMVNMPTQKPTWLHNRKEIIQDSRVFATSNNLEHILTIRNVKFIDEGEYTIVFVKVTSRLQIVVKGIFDLSHKQQLQQEGYRNWVRSTLALKYLKIGLEKVTDQMVKQQHEYVLRLVNGSGCTRCNSENLLPHSRNQCKRLQNKNKCLCTRQAHSKRFCPTGGYCGNLYDLIVSYHRYNDPTLKNTTIGSWSTEPWSVATCYINTAGYRDRKSSLEVDCSGILSLLINNTQYILDADVCVFEKARDLRNEILHNAKYELSEGQLNDCIDCFKNVLEVKNSSGAKILVNEPTVREALEFLNKLKEEQIEIYLSHDIENNLENLRKHAMNDVAEALIAAETQKEIENSLIEDKMEKTCAEHQLRKDIQSANEAQQEVDKTRAETFYLDFQIKIIGIGMQPKTTFDANRCVYAIMKDEIGKSDDESDQVDYHCYIKTKESIGHLIGRINGIKDTELYDLRNNESYIELNIKCFTCKSIEHLLRLFNEKEFQKEIVKIRKYLEVEGQTGKSFVIEASCSSASINETRKKLQNLDVLTKVHEEMKVRYTDVRRTIAQDTPKKTMNERIRRKSGSYNILEFSAKDDKDDINEYSETTHL